MLLLTLQPAGLSVQRGSSGFDHVIVLNGKTISFEGGHMVFVSQEGKMTANVTRDKRAGI